MLKKMAARFTHLKDLDLSQSASQSFYPSVTVSDLSVIASGFTGLCVLNFRTVKKVVIGTQTVSDGGNRNIDKYGT
ncbi:hypothetical protein HanRHA438_Chr04g0162881 [Helianthus annuus]|nr:hypothetical protein HanRHA438_Chr04g0162881 [Helianthus annuus]